MTKVKRYLVLITTANEEDQIITKDVSSEFGDSSVAMVLGSSVSRIVSLNLFI